MIIYCLGSGKMLKNKQLTAHGVGLGFAFWLQQNHGFSAWKKKGKTYTSVGILENMQIQLITNDGKVNDAGKVLSNLKIKEDFLLVHDDVAVPFGNTKLVLKTSGDGGHNGVKSVLENAPTSVLRLKIGLKGYKGLTNVNTLLDEPIETAQFTTVFEKALASIRSSILLPLKKKQLENERLTQMARASIQICRAHATRLNTLYEELNIPQRAIKSSAPPAIAVLPQAKAVALIQSAMTLIEAIMISYQNYRNALNVPGKHEIVEIMRRFVPENIWLAGDAQKGVVPQYLNLDFHAGNGTTTVSLIEGNLSMGGPDETIVIEKYLLQQGLLPEGVSTMNASHILDAEPTGISAITDYVIKPFIARPEDLVAIVDTSTTHTTSDAHTHFVERLLNSQGYNAMVCDAGELVFDNENHPTKVSLHGQKVTCIWDRLDTAGTIIPRAVSLGLVSLMPFQGLRQYTRKSGLVNLSDPQTRQALGIGHMGQQLDQIVPFSTYVTPENLRLLQLMRKTTSFAVKHVVGGGGRGSFIVGPTGQNSAYILNEAARSFATEPAIMQELAPRFDLPGTIYEFDVRVLIYTANAYKEPQYKLHWLARVYEKGGDKPLGFTPILVV